MASATVSGAYWARDTLLWSLPGLLLVEPATARQVLRFAFRYDWKHPGMHAQYINGAILYPGFELDELAAGATLELKRHALELLRTAPMDGGFVCETVDPATGRARSGAAFTAAGYVAWAVASEAGRTAQRRSPGSAQGRLRISPDFAEPLPAEPLEEFER